MLERVKTVLTSNYALIKDVFKHYSAMGTEVYTMGWNSFTKFGTIAEIPDKNFSRAEVDMLFIACSRAQSGVSDLNPSHSLTRYQFVTALCYLAVSKYKRTGVCSNSADALEMLLKNNVKLADHDMGEKFRWKRALYCEEIDKVFRQHLLHLQVYSTVPSVRCPVRV